MSLSVYTIFQQQNLPAQGVRGDINRPDLYVAMVCPHFWNMVIVSA
jgi:hypothetical protein